MNKQYMIVHFIDGETLTIRADYLKDDNRGFLDFTQITSREDELEKTKFVATVQSANVKYVIYEFREE